MMSQTQTTGRKVRSIEIINQRITSDALFNKLRELVIQHAGEDYRLRITANNKLILTK
ncbi:MAG: hemin uptake protein HemP [Alphaproteobacteria bacterium]|nr:hemin uptake protein HemP [Alphaproteobacteria bacterium]